jgi:hypothetical protein
MVRIVNTIAKSTTEINESAKDMITVQYINPDENRILKFGLLTKIGNIPIVCFPTIERRGNSA